MMSDETKNTQCPTCGGSGCFTSEKCEDNHRDCPTCHGTGDVPDQFNSSGYHGKEPRKSCPTCKGTGIQPKAEPEISSCCGAPMRTMRGNDVDVANHDIPAGATYWYECMKCNWSCDAVPGVDKGSKAPELRHKDLFLQRFNETLAHFGDETSLAMLAETASQVMCEATAALITQARIDELEQLLTNINIAEGYKAEPNQELRWPNSLILNRLAKLKGEA